MKREEIFLLPNIITFLRLVLTFPLIYFVLEEKWKLSAVIGSVAIISDFADGTVARKLKMTSDFGRKFDPTVDKIVLISLFFVLLVKDMIPEWFGIIVLGKDIIVPLVILVGKLKGAELNFSPTKFGKAAVVLQFTFIILFMAEKATGIRTPYELLTIPVLLFCFLSVMSYVVLISKISRKPRSF
ncbi:MAG: CDP-alcohol phosphatidyltransferase family protein [Candidatus Calescibacterium sp.]